VIESGVGASASVEGGWISYSMSGVAHTTQQYKTHLIMIQNDPILQTFVFFGIANSQQIAQSIDFELVEVLVDCAV
jgi:hypothetical protein